MAVVTELVANLSAEGEALDALVAHLPDPSWRLLTPAEGWTIAHTIAHLAWTDEVSHQAVTEPDRFATSIRTLLPAPDGAGSTAVDDAAARGAVGAPVALLRRWRRARTALAGALLAVPPGTKLPWFGPPMSAASMATARLMETWAHGRDIADALLRRHPGETSAASLRAVAHLGVRTRDFAYQVNGRRPPAEQFRVELAAPDGDTWAWGPEDAAQQVRGPALDFCLLVTRRRHPDDLAIEALGPDAQEWLGLAQAFAGPPGRPRQPRDRRAY